MADLTQSISESFNLFGGRTDLWNAFNWGAFKWGEGTAPLIVDVTDLISESLSPSDAITRFDSIGLVSETLSPTNDMTSEGLTDGSGYSYIFPSDVTNHESQAIPSYTTGSDPSSTWTSATAGSTTWS